MAKEDKLRDVQAFLDTPKEIAVNGKAFGLAVLRPVDFAEARAYVIGQRTEQAIKSLGTAPLRAEVQAKIFSDIATAKLTFWDVIDDLDGRLFLLWKSIVRGGETIKLDEVRKGLDSVEQDKLFAFLMWASRIWEAPGVEEASPAPLE